VRAGLPLGGNPALQLQALERWIQRTKLDVESVPGRIANGTGDRVAVKRARTAACEGPASRERRKGVPYEDSYITTVFITKAPSTPANTSFEDKIS
jgi:hypothetical protein